MTTNSHSAHGSTAGSGRKLFPWWKEAITEFVVLCTVGVVVAVFMALVVNDTEAARRTNRAIGDAIMRSAARTILSAKSPVGLGIMFVAVGDQTCRDWLLKGGAPCTVGYSIPRERLAELVEAIQSANPVLLVIDVDLPPGPVPTLDRRLCLAVRAAAEHFPVITPRPMALGAGGMEEMPSLLDACGKGGSQGLLFASPSLLTDADGIVRQVQKWLTTDGHVLPGIGLLAAAVVNPPYDKGFTCAEGGRECAIRIGSKTYRVGADPSRFARIQYTLPWQSPHDHTARPLGYEPARFDTIEASDLLAQPTTASRLTGSAVFLGASHSESGDLHATPLGAATPGAVVHANAMAAFGSGQLVHEDEGYGLECALIGLAAGLGTMFNAAEIALHGLPGRIRLTAWLVALGGTAFNCLVVLVVGVCWAEYKLTTSGTVVGAFTPALAVALEGLAGPVAAFKEFLRHQLRQLHE